MFNCSGKPYRLTSVELALPNPEGYMFRQACSFYSFTLDRENFHWNYKTFLRKKLKFASKVWHTKFRDILCINLDANFTCQQPQISIQLHKRRVRTVRTCKCTRMCIVST